MSDKVRPFLRNCQFCGAKGDDAETIYFTMECDVIDEFPYSYTIRCIGCGVSLNDEYEDEVVRRWNGETAPVDEDEGD